jgi:serine/threonine protein phosphatase 1
MQELQRSKKNGIGRTLVLGDVHGAYRAVKQVFERAGLDYENDTVIFLGDICDGWPEVPEAIEELKKVKNLIHLLGNHDLWTLHWMLTGVPPFGWLEQGGKVTYDAYMNGHFEKKDEHAKWLRAASAAYVDDSNRCFVHAGLGGKSIEDSNIQDLIWDRELWQLSAPAAGYGGNVTIYDEVYIGHTAEFERPKRRAEVWNLDTGAGWDGFLTLMDIETKQFWQSDRVTTLYPEHRGRR